MRYVVAAFCLCLSALGCGRFRYEQRQCPPDTIEVGDDASIDFCIERTERGIDEQHQAGKVCWDAGRRMCSAAEFARACTELGSAMVDSTDDWEWTGDTIAPMYDQATIVGQTSCGATSTGAVVGVPDAFRCCVGR